MRHRLNCYTLRLAYAPAGVRTRGRKRSQGASGETRRAGNRAEGRRGPGRSACGFVRASRRACARHCRAQADPHKPMRGTRTKPAPDTGTTQDEGGARRTHARESDRGSEGPSRPGCRHGEGPGQSYGRTRGCDGRTPGRRDGEVLLAGPRAIARRRNAGLVGASSPCGFGLFSGLLSAQARAPSRCQSGSHGQPAEAFAGPYAGAGAYAVVERLRCGCGCSGGAPAFCVVGE